MKQAYIFCFDNGNVYAVFQDALEARKHLENLREEGFVFKSEIRGIATFYTMDAEAMTN